MRFLKSLNVKSRKDVDCVKRIRKRHYEIMMNADEDPMLYDLVRDDMGLEAICERKDEFQDPIGYVAHIIDCISYYHPFAEGNKRTAFALALCLLDKYGYGLPNNEETYRFFMDCAMTRYDREEIEEWLRNHITIR